MKKLLTLFFLLAAASTTRAQVKVGFYAGANRSDIVETNDLPNWNTIKPNYDVIYGYHGGLLAEFPLSKKGNFVFQPNVAYYNKGRKYFERFDPLVSTLQDSGVKQLINYIDIPLNLILKIRLAKKIKFIIGAGPYASFFLSGREKTTTTDLAGVVTTTTNADLPVGDGPGKYRTMDYGVNVIAGFEIGRVFLRADASQSLGDMYQASSYKGKFKNQVIGVSLGVMLDIKGSEPVKKLPDTTAAKKPAEVKDKDGDGVVDKDDDCPKEFGSAATKGCPDKDGDGVADKDDKCPDVKGTIANKGCPETPTKPTNPTNPINPTNPTPTNPTNPDNQVAAVDTDGDGITDDVDQCPTVKGYSRYHGCPIPDTDGDGINDELDKCPTVPGVRAKRGCPEATQPEKVAKPEVPEQVISEVNDKAGKIQFSQSSITLNAASMSALDDVVTLLNNNPGMQLNIEGHASVEGDDYVNLGLSNSRANAVRNYLVSKGIDRSRLHVAYFGATRLLTNDPAQQSINRRVELKPFY